MHNGDLVLVQNVIGRITHGLIGLDLYKQGNTNNKYLEDFLTLRYNEVKDVLNPLMQTRDLIPIFGNQSVSMKSVAEIVKKTQEIIRNIDKINQEEIDRAMSELENALNIVYSNFLNR
jgi:hypothetical protein